VLTPYYNRAGALERVELDGTPYIEQVVYNPKGQRILIVYGNGVMTRHGYDPRTFQLVRLRSERYWRPSPAPDQWRGQGAPLQDLTYGYDLVGNITSIEERTPGCGIAGGAEGRDRMMRSLAYDPLYRLTEATGRACKDVGAPRPIPDAARCGTYPPPYAPGPPVPNQANAPNATEPYAETYAYDPAGNLLQLSYAAPSGSWSRRFGLGEMEPDRWRDAPTNRLTRLEQGAEAHDYGFDANGNLHRQNSERRLDWDHADRLIGFTVQPGGATRPSVEARYLYGADGTRVKKWVRTSGTGEGESTVYIDGAFEHHRWKKAGQSPKSNNYIHVFDGQGRAALVRRGPAAHGDAGPPVQYHLGDHLGSSSVVVRDDGAWVNREEYFPYGETSFGGFARKRYRFSGKERDEQTGFCYHGARYYAPWLAKWTATDPSGISDGLNLYTYAQDNPIAFNDIDGRQAGNPGVIVGSEMMHGIPHVRYRAEEGTWVSTSLAQQGYDKYYGKEEAYGAYREVVWTPEGKPLKAPDRIVPGQEYLVPELPQFENTETLADPEPAVAQSSEPDWELEELKVERNGCSGLPSGRATHHRRGGWCWRVRRTPPRYGRQRPA
jgi:RHS repeat-associated protein